LADPAGHDPELPGCNQIRGIDRLPPRVGLWELSNHHDAEPIASFGRRQHLEHDAILSSGNVEEKLMDFNLHTFFFYLIACLTGLCAIGVVVTQNIVRSAAWLLFTLAGVSGIFFLLNADFVGATQLLIYVGGTLVLVVFGVMLTAQGPFINMKTGAAEWVIAAFVGIALFSVLSVATWTAWSIPKNVPPADDPALSRNSVNLGLGFLGVPVGPAHKESPSDPVGSGPSVRASYLLPFEIVSVHLLVVLIGAAYLARAKRRRGGTS
jgi:NADH-quinone oxidoreductase subunit J